MAMTKQFARDVMVSPVLTIREDSTVPELATFLTENSISGAPVLDARGKLVGVVSVTDIAEDETSSSLRPESGFHTHGWEGRLNREDLSDLRISDGARQVRDIMTPTFFTIPDDTPVPEIAKTMVAGRIHRLLVTRKSQIVGIVSALDLLKLLTGPSTAQPRKASQKRQGSASASAETSARAERAAQTSARTSARPRERKR
jgi:CBS domain-containing protein